jgi:hypothetical protein
MHKHPIEHLKHDTQRNPCKDFAAYAAHALLQKAKW